jgi:hypothetical protein
MVRILTKFGIEKLIGRFQINHFKQTFKFHNQFFCWKADYIENKSQESARMRQTCQIYALFWFASAQVAALPNLMFV